MIKRFVEKHKKEFVRLIPDKKEYEQKTYLFGICIKTEIVKHLSRVEHGMG